MRRLSSLGSKQLAHRKGRSALTALGIVLGVAILFGVLVTNATTQAGVDLLVADFAGNADVLVSPLGAFDAVMPEQTITKLEHIDGVEVAAASLSFRSAIRVPGHEIKRDFRGTGDVAAYGVDLASAAKVQPYTLETGRLFERGAPEMIVPRRLVDARALKLDQTYPVHTPHGLASMRLVGILTDTGSGRTNQGDVFFTSIQQARTLMKADDVISGARLVLKDGIDVDAWIDEHGDDAGPGLDFLDAGALAQGFKSFLAILGAMFTFFAAITLFVGAFLIYLTLSMAVIERTRIYGTMRALGSTRGQVRRVVIAEALALGSVSTVVGLGLGLLIAKGLLVLVSGLFQIDLPGLTIRPSAVVTGIVVGIVVTTISSLVPARRAARLSPVVAMKGNYRTETRLSRAWIAGLVAAVVGVASGMGGGSAGAIGTPLILLGSVLLVPLLLRPLASVLGRLTNRIARGVGDIAVLHLVKERSRSAYTLALVMVVMAMIFSIGGLNASLSQALEDSLDRQFGSDISVDTAGALDATFERKLKGVEGVGEVTAIRYGRAKPADRDDDEDAFLRIVDPTTYFRVASFLFIDGTENDAKKGLAGGGMLLPVERATTLNVKVGDSLAVHTTTGVRKLKLVATFQSFGGPPEMVVGLPDARRYFNAGNPGGFQLNVAPGANVNAVKTRIEDTLGEEHALTVATSDGIKQEAQKQFGQFFNVFYAIIMVAAIVGLLGLANTLAMSVIQRTREIGILRAIGVTRSQVRRMVLVESATLGIVAFALSLLLGFVLSVVTLGGVSGAFGFDVAYVYPAAWVPVVGAFGVIVAVLAAVAPGRRASKLHVVGALQYE